MKLTQLIQLSQSMGEAEKKHWLALLPHMSKAQKEKLRRIFTNEQATLQQIDSLFEQDEDTFEQTLGKLTKLKTKAFTI